MNYIVLFVIIDLLSLIILLLYFILLFYYVNCQPRHISSFVFFFSTETVEETREAAEDNGEMGKRKTPTKTKSAAKDVAGSSSSSPPAKKAKTSSSPSVPVVSAGVKGADGWTSVDGDSLLACSFRKVVGSSKVGSLRLSQICHPRAGIYNNQLDS